MTIFVDLDHTLNLLYKSYNESYLQLYNKDLKLTRGKLKSYFFHDITKEAYLEAADRTHKIFSIPGFWENVPIYPDAKNVMSFLCSYHDVFIVTAPWVENENCYLEKVKWVKNNLPFFDINNIIFTKHKSLLIGDIMIDDNPDYLIHNRCKKTIKMWYPYNDKIPVLEAHSWKDIKNLMIEIQETEGWKYGRQKV